MSKLRPETANSKEPALPYDTALYLIRDAVDRRNMLGHGALFDRSVGAHCAIGAFWKDNPGCTLSSALIDEVAAVNDSVPNASPKQRWLKTRSWLRWKVRLLTNPTSRTPVSLR